MISSPYGSPIILVSGDIKFIPKFEGGHQPTTTRNALDCDQSNYSSRIVFSLIPFEFGEIGNSAIRSDDPENLVLEPNTE